MAAAKEKEKKPINY